MFTNQLNHSSFNRLYLLKVVTKSLHSRYNDSRILGNLRNEKSLNTFHIKAFSSGADETRTRDLLRDRQWDLWILSYYSKEIQALHTYSILRRKEIQYVFSQK